MYMKTKNHFYDKFVNEENLKNIDDAYIRGKFQINFWMIPIFLLVCIGAFTHQTYNLMRVSTAFSFVVAFVSLYIVVSCVVGIIRRDKKYHVFNKHWHLIVFLLVYFALAVALCMFSFLTAEYSTDDNGLVVMTINVAPYYIFFIPLTIGYTIFCYFAYGKCFGKYSYPPKQYNEEAETEGKEINVELLNTKTSNAFYNRFVNEENFKHITNSDVWDKLWMYYITIPLFIFLSVLSINFLPITNFASIIFALIFLLIAFKCIDGFCLIDKEQHLFKKHKNLIRLLSIHIILAVIFYLVFIITAKYNADKEIVLARFTRNIILCLLIYFPLSLGYTVFSFYAYGKSFAKYSRESRLHQTKYVKNSNLFLKQNSEDIKIEYKEKEDNELSNEKKYNPFYSRFVNEENLKNIEDINIRKRFYGCGSGVPSSLFFSVLWIAMSGYNFDKWYNAYLFGLAVFLFLCALFFTIKLVLLDKKYHVFKEHRLVYIFLSGYFILSIVFYVIAYFRITFVSPFDSSVELDGNIIFCLFIYLPLLIMYSSFCKRAYNKCFWKYTKGARRLRDRKRNKSKKNINNIEKKDSEDDTSV